MITPNVYSETSDLRIVVLGTPNDFGDTPILEDCYDPKSRENIVLGTFPLQDSVNFEMNEFLKVLEKYNVEVLRPTNIPNLNQIFARDISFVIEDKIIVPNIILERREEIKAISHVFNIISENNILTMPENSRVEGGDVMIWNDYIFIGYSREEDFNNYKVARTNFEAVSFIQKQFPHKTVRAFELNKSDLDPRENALHLDCCFQPVGKRSAILYMQGFKNKADVDFLVDLFSEKNIIFISKEEMYNMNANVFSISENVVVSEKNFLRLNKELRNRGLIVEEIEYSQIAKMEGLLRCSTMPLVRE